MIKFFILLCFLIFILIINKNNSYEHFKNDDIPILIITDKKYFNQQKKLLNQIGFYNIYFIEPVYIKDSSLYCNNLKVSKSELGCSYAHLNALKKIIKLNKSCLILEKDWSYSISNKILKKEILKYYNLHQKNNYNITYLGYCGNGCTHGYIISPKIAIQIINKKKNLCNNPVDIFYNKYFCKNNKCFRVPNKYKYNKKLYGGGLILQDRFKYIGMHNHFNKRTSNFIK